MVDLGFVDYDICVDWVSLRLVFSLRVTAVSFIFLY
jgi:hypothetical protein